MGRMATQAEPSGIRVRARGRGFIVAGLMMAVSLAALDSSVVGTAMPTIVGTLGGLRLFSWIFSVYLLTSTVTVPVYGKLADLYGRKPVIVFGAVMFLAGSALCGAANSMVMLIFFRAIQGLGAGAVLPIAITIIGDIFSIEERAKIQGLFSGVWGVAGVAGPALGGMITDTIGWRWVFFVNLPLGLAAIGFLSFYYHETNQRRRAVLDYWGAALLSGAVVALLLAILQGGRTYGWLGGPTLGLFATAAVLLALFILQERRAPEPVIPLGLFSNRVIAISSLAVLVAGAVFFGISSYIPLFEQGVFGGSATMAGLVLAPMSVSWVVAATFSGRAILRWGFYPPALAGGFCLLAGALVLLGLNADGTIAVAVLATTIMGAGLGLIMNSTVIAVQNAVDWGQRGVATATTQFFRTIGGSISVAMMGALLDSRMSSRLGSVGGVPAGTRAEDLLNQVKRGELAPQVLQGMREALGASLHETFFILVAAAALCLAVLSFFPRQRAAAAAASSGARVAALPES
jgi:EmrB/QacA subfamily drug resistance transporter